MPTTTYDITAPNGKTYRMEANEGISQEQALKAFQELPEKEWEAYEYTAPTVKDIEPTVEPATDQKGSGINLPEFDVNKIKVRSSVPTVQNTLNPWDINESSSRYTREIRNNPQAEALAQSLWDQGVRDPQVFNRNLGKLLGNPEYNVFNNESIATIRRREAYYAAKGVKVPLFSYVEQTGEKDPERPDDILGTAGNAAARSTANIYNSGVGLAALGADLVGADETSDALLQDYITNNAKIQWAYGNPINTSEVKDLHSGALFTADVFGELAPQLVGSLGLGYLGKEGATLAIKKGAQELIEAKVEQGIAREVAERQVLDLLRKRAAQGAAGGAAAWSIPQETGSTFGTTYEQTGEKAPVSSILAGIASGSLDSVLPLTVLKKLGGKPLVDQFKKGLLARLAKEGGKGFILEGGTEALQEFITSLPKSVVTGESPFNEQVFDQMYEAFVRGGLGGTGTNVAVETVNSVRTAGPQNPAPRYTGEPIVVPDGKKGTKAYKQQLGQAQDRVIEQVNSLTEGWTNVPDIEVHDNFSKLKGVDNTAIGVYSTKTLDDGTVVPVIKINTEAVIERAKKRDVSPESVVEAVTFHEGLGHHGLTSLFREDLDQFLADVYNNGSEQLQDKVDSWLRKNPNAYSQFDEGQRLVLATEEVMAEWSEGGPLARTFYDNVANYIKDFARTRLGMNLKYTEREVKAYLAVAHERTMSGEKIGATPTTAKNIYAGEVGAGDFSSEAKDLRWVKEQYEDEMTFASDPRTVKEINEAYGPKGNSRTEFGWFRGPDGGWRFEINDAKPFEDMIVDKTLDMSRFKSPNNDDSRVLRLADVLDHPKLYDMYPELQDYAVSRNMWPGDWRGAVQGWFDPDLQAINITPTAKNPETTLLHEVQHAVQEIEGFARGGSPDTALESLPYDLLVTGANNLKQHLKNEAKYGKITLKGIEYVGNLPEFKEYARLKKTANNLYDIYASVQRPIDEARWKEATKARDEALKKLRIALGLPERRSKMSAGDSKLFDEIMFNLGDDGKLNKYGQQLKAKIEETEENAKLLEYYIKKQDADGIREIVRKDSGAKHSVYEHLFGEVEARDTQDRASFDVTDRLLTDPYSMEPDINPDHYVVSRPRQTFSQSTDKYMRGDSPIDPDQLTADDLIEAENALDILNRIEYTPKVVSPDQLEAEAIARNLPPSDITRLVGMEPGKLMKRLFLYDVAATKLSDRAAKIKADIDTNGLTKEKQLAYIEATVKLSDLTSQIFDFQAEIGRTLAANRRVNFSRKRVRDLKKVLEQYGLEALADPETFMKYMATIEEQTASGKARKVGTDIVSIINIPRAIMSSADLSAPLRQGIVFIGYKEFWMSFLKMFSLIGKNGETNYQFLMRKIATHPNYELMQKARLQFSSLDGELSSREEDFQTELARKIPGFGRIVKASEQAYAGFLNKLRADMFNRFVSEYEGAGVTLDEDGLKGLGQFINAATGRAELPQFIRPSATVLNATFFSARLMYSRVQMLNPMFYAQLPGPVRISAGMAMFRFGVIALMVNMALNLMWPDEVETEIDLRSSEFMKVKVGNTRFDLGGGFNQYLILGARTGTWLYNQGLGLTERLSDYDMTDYKVANKKTSAGEFQEFGAEKITQDSYLSVLGDFFRSKLSPQASYIIDAMAEKDYIGRPFTLEGSLASRLVPMTASSLYDAYKEDSPVPMPVIFGSALFGVGVNTYTSPSIDPKRELEAPPSFQMKDLEDGSNDFIVAKDGEVTLKKAARDRWTETLNNYYGPYVEEVAAEEGVKFEEADDETKKDIIEEALKRTREAAKKDMMFELGLSDE